MAKEKNHGNTNFLAKKNGEFKLNMIISTCGKLANCAEKWKYYFMNENAIFQIEIFTKWHLSRRLKLNFLIVGKWLIHFQNLLQQYNVISVPQNSAFFR